MHEKFGRQLRDDDGLHYNFDSEFSVETYLDYQGDKFVERFDANTYLYLTRAMDYFDLGEDRGGLDGALGGTTAAFCVVSFTTDWLFTPDQSRKIVRALSRSGRPVSYVNVDSPYGHDSFLLDCDSQDRAIAGFLNRLSVERDGGVVAFTGEENARERRDPGHDRAHGRRGAERAGPGLRRRSIAVRPQAARHDRPAGRGHR